MRLAGVHLQQQQQLKLFLRTGHGDSMDPDEALEAFEIGNVRAQAAEVILVRVMPLTWCCALALVLRLFIAMRWLRKPTQPHGGLAGAQVVTTWLKPAQ